MDLAQPLFPPPEGRMWHLHRGVNVYTGDGRIDGCPLPEGDDADGVHHTNFHGRATWTKTSNFGVDGAPDASMYELGRWIFASFNVYSDGALVATMAIEPGKDSTSPVINIYAADVQRYYAAPPALWPETLEYVTTSHSHDVVEGSIGIEILKWVGDVWVAEPACDSYECLLGDDGGRKGCPPPCQPTTSALAANSQALRESITVGWGRTNARIDASLSELGKLGELTWPEMWDGPRLFMLDGLTYEAKALDRGGFTESCEWTWVKLPLTDAAGNPLYAMTDVTLTDDLELMTLPS